MGLGAAQMSLKDHPVFGEQKPKEEVITEARTPSSIHITNEKPSKDQEDVRKKAYDDVREIFLNQVGSSINNIVAKQTLKASPELQEKYGYLNKLSPKSFSELVQHNTELQRDLGRKHYDKLHETFGGNENHMIYAWHNGTKKTQNDINSGVDISNNPVVQGIKQPKEQND
jgi:hypothetical protein